MNALFLHFTKPVPKAGGEYSEGVVGQPLYINPLLSQTSEADSDLAKLIYSGLFKFDKDGKTVPDIAQSYEVSDDQRTYTIHLRNGIKWQDGQDLTADDALFTYNILMDQAYKSPLRQNWQGVDVQKTDDYTLVFTLKNPYVGFLDNLTVGILPKHVWEDISPEKFALAEYNLHPVGSGPFMYSDMQKDSSGTILTYGLTANKKYYGGSPYIAKMTFDFYPDDDALLAAYNKKEVMGMGNISPEKISSIKNAKSTNLHELTIPRYFAVFLNQTKSAVLADDTVRAALAASVDRQSIISQVLHGKGIPLSSPLFPGMQGYDDGQAKHQADIAAAEKMLDDAGWKKGDDGMRAKNGTKLSFELVTADWPELNGTAQMLKDQWKKIGADVTVNALSVSDLQQNRIRDREYDSLLFGQAISFNPDLYSFWHSTQKHDPGANLAVFDNKDADGLLESIRQEADQSKRADDYDQLRQIFSKENPAVFLYGPNYVYPVFSTVQGVDAQNINLPADRFVDVEKWYVRTSRVWK